MVASAKILICGSNQFSSCYFDMAENFGRHFARFSNNVFVSGGTKSIDGGATLGASHIIASSMRKELSLRVDRCRRMLTILPGVDDSYVSREPFGDTRQPKHHDRRSRRTLLVQQSDLVVPLEGNGGSAKLMELARQLRKPVLPFVSTGGDSALFWEMYRSEIVDQCRIRRVELRRIESHTKDFSSVADVMLKVICRALSEGSRPRSLSI